jgi:hypothetical protein
MEYMKSEWYINMSVAIDYTLSNGDPTDPKSLHYLDLNNSSNKNQYEKAIAEVGGVLEHYAYRKKFTAYGFGAIIDD